MAKARLLFLVCISLLVLTPGVAQAGEAQCGNRLIHDWYVDGQIQGRYRVSCYRKALADVPTGDAVYGTVRKDLTQALSSGVERVKQEGVTARPQTLLPAPQRQLAAVTPTTTSQKSYPVRSLVVLAFLALLLLLWCVVRWRGRGLIR